MCPRRRTEVVPTRVSPTPRPPCYGSRGSGHHGLPKGLTSPRNINSHGRLRRALRVNTIVLAVVPVVGVDMRPTPALARIVLARRRHVLECHAPSPPQRSLAPLPPRIDARLPALWPQPSVPPLLDHAHRVEDAPHRDDKQHDEPDLRTQL